MNELTMFGGLRLRDDFEDEEPRIQDLELAMRLGYARPRDIRPLIESIQSDGLLNNIAFRGVGPRNPGDRGRVAAKEYWLTEIEAVFVIGQSRTPIARTIHLEVVTAFVAYRRGRQLQAPVQVQAPVHRLLAEAPCEWDMMWPASLIKALCRLYGYYYESGSYPSFLQSAFDKIYRLVAGREESKAVKKINPHPRFGSNHHQWFEPTARKNFREHLRAIEGTALLSRSIDEFWDRLESYYLNRPLQLTLVETGPRRPRGKRRHRKGRHQ